MKKTMSKTAQRKLGLRSESILVLDSSQLTVVGGGVLQNPTQKPHSAFQGCPPTFI